MLNLLSVKLKLVGGDQDHTIPDSDDNQDDSSSQPMNMLLLMIPRNPIKLLLMLFSLITHQKIRMMKVFIQLLEVVIHMIQLKKVYNRITETQMLNLLQVLSNLQETWTLGTRLKTMTAGKEHNSYHVLIKLAYEGLENTEMPGM